MELISAISVYIQVLHNLSIIKAPVRLSDGRVVQLDAVRIDLLQISTLRNTDSLYH
jgi:hypothetical protein